MIFGRIHKPHSQLSWFIGPISKVYGSYIELVNGDYKPTYTWGGTTLKFQISHPNNRDIGQKHGDIGQTTMDRQPFRCHFYGWYVDHHHSWQLCMAGFPACLPCLPAENQGRTLPELAMEVMGKILCKCWDFPMLHDRHLECKGRNGLGLRQHFASGASIP